MVISRKSCTFAYKFKLTTIMKYNLQVTDVTHEELVSIFSMLCCENDFAVNCKKKDWEKIKGSVMSKWPKNIVYCFEDKCADILLNGGKVYVTDIQAEEQVYGTLPHTIDAEDESVTYEVTLQDFLKGFSNPDAMKYVKDLAIEDDDYWTAYNLIQFAIFGEQIYG